MEQSDSNEPPGAKPMELFVAILLLAAWIVLQAWVLPRMGVKT